MKHVFVVCLLVMALGGVSVVSADTPAATESPTRNTTTLQLLDGLQDFIEQLDQFLESIVDLLETLRRLFGG